jgi:hypothetical protein
MSSAAAAFDGADRTENTLEFNCTFHVLNENAEKSMSGRGGH